MFSDGKLKKNQSCVLCVSVCSSLSISPSACVHGAAPVMPCAVLSSLRLAISWPILAAVSHALSFCFVAESCSTLELHHFVFLFLQMDILVDSLS